MDCENKLQCAACLVMYDKSSWSIHERKNHENQKTSWVCRSCREKGYYPQNVQTYTCQRCKQQLGGKKFDSDMLNNFEHHHQPKLVCKECTQNETKLVKELHMKLRKSKRQCNCFLPLHKERCPLAPCYHGERRWPGSDGYISINDRDFLNSPKPPPDWWKKALG